jgi:hypothetical protein
MERYGHAALTGLLDFTKMTVQTQQFIELSDLLAFRVQCGNPECKVVLLIPIAGTINGALRKCPKCKRAWAGQDDGPTHEPDIQRFADSLKLLSQLKLGCSLALEVSLPEVSRKP